MTSSIAADTDLADTVHALAELERRPNDLTFVRDRLAAIDAALARFESTLAQPLAELAPHVHRTYLAAVALACAFRTLAPGELEGLRRTTIRLLDMLEPLASPADRALRARLVRHALLANVGPTTRA